MTTHTWAENPRGAWRLSIILDSEQPQEGTIFEWTLLLHGTQKPPYENQKVAGSPHSKLAVVKREHQGPNFRFD
jgi:proprotein convertase subtilisin/kexin type 2